VLLKTTLCSQVCGEFWVSSRRSTVRQITGVSVSVLVGFILGLVGNRTWLLSCKFRPVSLC
jgi:ABC-type nitrate/sulfonate/bicarbonate transport system permease component